MEGRQITKFPKFQPFTYFEVWTPRWHDKVAMLDARKVKRAKTDYLKIKFTDEPDKRGHSTPAMLELMEHDWVITRRRAAQFKQESNGSIMNNVIPLAELEPYQLSETHSMEEIW